MSNSATTQNISFNPILTCQPNHIIYPARLALSTARLEQTSQSDTALKLPAGMPQPGDDYELRSLRSGYIYLLSLAVADEETMSAKGEDGLHAWYIYYYSSEDIPNKDGGLDYRFQQYRYDELDLRRPRQRIGLAEYYLRLPQYVNKIDIMYSDMELAPELLDELVKNPTARRHWMRNVTLDTSEGPVEKVDRLNRFRASVKDLSEEAKPVSQEPSNIMRSAFIGHRTQFDTLINQVGNCSNIHVVALEDPVGTARDLADYQLYLTAEREKILDKYEYAITTAQIVQAYAQENIIRRYQESKDRIAHTDWEELRRARLDPPVAKPITLAQSYRTLRKYIKTVHLEENSHNDVFEDLKTELQLEDIPGVNAIHKMANISGLYGTHFKHVVAVHVDFIAQNQTRLDILSSLFQQDERAITAAECWCLYLHGLYYGLDLSPYGHNALVAAFSDNAIESNAQQADSNTIAVLRQKISALVKILPAIETVAKNKHFKITTYDLLTDVLVTKHLAVTLNGGKLVRGMPKEVVWQRVYEVNPLTKKALPKGKGTVVIPDADMDYKKFGLDAKFLEPSYKPFYTSSGLVKVLSYQAVIGLFTGDNNYKTVEGQLANNSVLNVMVMFAGNKAPPGGMESAMAKAKVELTERASVSHNKASKKLIYKLFPQTTDTARRGITLMQLKAGLVSANSALTFLGGLMEYGIWTEMRYRGDSIGMNAAMLRGFGGVTLSASYGALGMLAGKAIATSLVVGALTLTLWIGAVALIAGVVMGFFSEDDMEAWLENGFWGKSENYWGKAVRGYEWEDENREDKFIDQFNESRFNYSSHGELESVEAVNYYQIEMQRYFQFKESIELSKYSSTAILVEHSSLTDNRMAQSIKVKRLIINKYWIGEQQPAYIEYLSEGKAVLHFATPWQVSVNAHSDEILLSTLKEHEVKEIQIMVSMADYLSSDKVFSSTLQTIEMK